MPEQQAPGRSAAGGICRDFQPARGLCDVQDPAGSGAEGAAHRAVEIGHVSRSVMGRRRPRAADSIVQPDDPCFHSVRWPATSRAQEPGPGTGPRGQGMALDAHREGLGRGVRSEEHTSELQYLMRISYAVFCLKTKNTKYRNNTTD